MRGILVCVVLLFSVQQAPAGTLTLHPSRDNNIIQSATGSLSNGQGDLFVGRTNQDGQGPATISIRRALIYFDIASALPADVVITAVSLSMRDVQGLNGEQLVTLHRAAQDWGEGGSFFAGGAGAPAQQNDTTWLHRFYNASEPAASEFWSAPGGDFDSASSGGTLISDALGPGQWFTWDSELHPQMIDDVQAWLTDPAQNFGWLLQGNENAGQTAKRLNGRESAFPPELTIHYTIVPEPHSLVLSIFAAAGVWIGRRTVRVTRSV